MTEILSRQLRPVRSSGLPAPRALLVLLSLWLCCAALIGPLEIHGVDGSIRITLQHGDKTTPCVTRVSTVEEFLDLMDITLGEMDDVSPALGERLQDGDDVVIIHREYIEHIETETIPFHTVYAHSPDLTAGEETVASEGVEGLAERVYARVLANGEVVEQTLLEERVVQPPTPRRVEMGFRTMPVSALDFGAEFDENGEPISYKDVLRDQRSAAYSAPAGAKTASGRAAAVGHVAVNPSVIPYGSKLFIQSRDGKFIYGYAVAADTGTSLINGTIAVDCFYDTYKECVGHGIKMVDVFILE